MGSNSNTLFMKAVPIAVGMGVLLSPDTLAMLGNIMGKTGWTGLVLILGSMAVFFIHAVNFQTMNQNNCAPDTSDFRLTRLDCLIIYLPWTARVFTTVFLSTGILVSSGFVFNEVFLYWFPNFGFAFLLLFLVLVLHLMGTSVAFKAQVIFVALTIAGLVLLILAGVFTPDRLAAPPVVQFQDRSLLFLPLLLWIGFDLGSFARNQKKTQTKWTGPLVITITLSGILFLLWGMVSIWHVPLEKLASTSIPHLKTARFLLGDTGRYIMGGVIIFGTLGAVNSLFLSCKINTADLSQQGMLPQRTRKYKSTAIVPVLLSLTIGVMMAKGLAGSEHLETWIRAGFILWLFSYGLVALKALTIHFSVANSVGFILTMAGVILLLSQGRAVL